MTVVVRNITRPSTAIVQKLQQAGVATAHEAQARTGLMQPVLRPIVPGASIAGPAVTVLAHPGDNWMLHVAIEMCLPGDVIVVACNAENHDGMLGDLLATSMRARGVVGAILDVGCRDVKTLRQMEFPVWSRSISAQGTVKATVGSVNIPVVCSGALVRPGDVVIADDDGVVVVPVEQAESVADACQQRMDREEAMRVRLAAGELGLDIYGMREKLAKAGLVYVDSPED